MERQHYPSYRFQPPRMSRTIWKTVNLLYPAVLALHDRVVRLTVEDGDWQHLQKLQGRRALLLPNHPSETEPSVLVGVSRRLGEPFHYVATHEIFQGFSGWILPKMGAFSLRRGWPDRPSLRMSQTILAARDAKLVLFPEGETHMSSDQILPLYQGAIQIGFWALERMESLGKEPHLPLVPIIIRYHYVGDAGPALLRGLGRLEERLGLPSAEISVKERLRRAGVAVLIGVEREYGIAAQADAPIDDRIRTVYEHVAGRVAHLLHVTVPARPSVPLTMRALFNAVFDYLDALSAGQSVYERRLHARRVLAARTCLADLWRMQNFMAISEKYLLPPLTAERTGEILYRLEKEVYGRPVTLPLREARLRIGCPWDLAEHLPAYRISRKRTVADCTARLEEQMRDLLAAGQ